MTLVESAVTLGNGITLSTVRRGAGSAPPVVLWPGPTDSWWSYQSVLEQLPATVNAVAVSPRGHGDSTKPASGYGIADFADDLVRLLDALAIERAVLVAHSGAGFVTRRVAVEHPGRVAGLVLEASPPTLRGNAAFADFLGSVLPGLRDPLDRDFARSFVADTATDALPPALVDRLVDEVLKVPAAVWRETFTTLGDADDRAVLGAIAAPTRLIWGDADPIVDAAAQATLRDGIPDCELLVYPGAGHTPRWEQPARFAADVAACVR